MSDRPIMTAGIAEGHPRDEGLGLLDLALLVSEHLKLLVAVPLLAGLLGLGISYLMKPTYTARALVMPPQQQQSAAMAALQSLGALAGLAGAGAGLKSPADQYVALMESTTVSDRVIDGLGLLAVYESKTRQEAREQLAANVRISVGKKDGLLSVEADDNQPARAASIANRFIEELRRLTNSLALTEAQQRRVFFDRQLLQTKERLVEAEKALQGSGIDEGVLRAEPRAAAESYAELKAQVTAAEVRLQTMQGYATTEAPEFKQSQARLAALRAQLRRAEATGQNAVGDYIAKYREFKYQETLFELFARQLELAKLDESREGVLVQIVDSATPPERKSKPRMAFIAIASSAAALLILLVFIVVRQSWRETVNATSNAHKAARLRASFRR